MHCTKCISAFSLSFCSHKRYPQRGGVLRQWRMWRHCTSCIRHSVDCMQFFLFHLDVRLLWQLPIVCVRLPQRPDITVWRWPSCSSRHSAIARVWITATLLLLGPCLTNRPTTCGNNMAEAASVIRHRQQAHLPFPASLLAIPDAHLHHFTTGTSAALWTGCATVVIHTGWSKNTE